MENVSRERQIHWFFEVGVILKGLNALLEIGVGTLLLFVNVAGFVQTLVENELVEDPGDFIASHIRDYVSHLNSGSEYFAALYLLTHGIVKGLLVAGLLREKPWAYPASLAVLVLFVLYQVVKIAENHSLLLVFFTLFDLVVMWLIYHEYHLRLQRKDAAQTR